MGFVANWNSVIVADDASAELLELGLRQVSKCSDHTEGRFVETVYGSSWPVVVALIVFDGIVQWHNSNHRYWQLPAKNDPCINAGLSKTLDRSGLVADIGDVPT